MSRQPKTAERVTDLLTGFRMTTAAAEAVPRLTQAGHQTSLPTLLEVLELEQEARHHRRVTRLRRASKLPHGKTFDTFDDARLKRPVSRKLQELQSGDFLDDAINVLAFGLPGVGRVTPSLRWGTR